MTAYPQGKLTIHQQNELLWYSFPAFDSYADKLLNGFSSRLGGISKGGAASLNLGLRMTDNQEAVLENYHIFASALGFDEHNLVFSQQTHTNNIRIVSMEDAGKGIFRERDYQDIDGLITTERNLPIITHHADCSALYFYDPTAQMIGLAHAGWRGTVEKIAAAMTEQMSALGAEPSRIIAAVGPCAGACCYEVGAEVAAQFAKVEDEQGAVITANPHHSGKFLLDIPRANRALMIQAGIKAAHITLSGLCTICHNDIFFSHRCQGLDRGAMAAVLMLK